MESNKPAQGEDLAIYKAISENYPREDLQERIKELEKENKLLTADVRVFKACWNAACNDIDESKHLVRIGQLVMTKLTSGNNVPVERCTITAKEVADLKE